MDANTPLQWTPGRFARLVSHTLFVLKEGDVLPLAEKLLRKEDGTFHPYAFADLPIGLREIRRFIFIACPHMTREILHQDASPNTTDNIYHRGRIGDIFKQELGDTLFTAETSKHQTLRQFASHYFRQSLDKRFSENLCQRTNELIDKWLAQEGKPVNATHDLPFFTARAIIDNFIGEIDDPMRLHHAMETVLRNMERQFKLRRPFPKEKMDKAHRDIREMAEKARTFDNGLLLTLMAQARDENGHSAFSSEDIESMARFLFLAGQETVASALPALLHHCTLEMQEKVREEWRKDNLDPNAREDIVKFSKKSKWVQGIINESLRLFPPAYAFVRVNRIDLNVKDVFISKDTEIVPFSLFFHRSKLYWGDDAEEFKPERWLSSQPEGSHTAFIPFGIGPNHCLGQPFARLEIGLFLTLFCLKVRWKSLTPSYDYTARFSLSSKKEIKLSVSRAELPSPDPQRPFSISAPEAPITQCPYGHH
jgi:cytochrome P450